MTKLVKILEGTYRVNGEDTSMAGQVFPLVKDYRMGSRGGYVTVDARAVPGLPDRNIKIMVDSQDSVEPATHSTPVQESDEEIIERLRKRFQMLEDMTRATKRGQVRAMIVSGPPGVGKSFGVEKVLSKNDLLVDIGGDKWRKYEVVKGAMSAIGLYCKLYAYKERDNVIVFDDCDSILLDDLSLNILKAALDSKRRRQIHWNTDSYKLRQEGVPDSFEFQGSVIFITNIKFDNVKSKKLKDHLEALESRCHYMDLTIDSEREKMLRIQQIVSDGMLDEYGFDSEQIEEIREFVDLNKNNLRELSLRTVIKTADLVLAFPDTWQDVAAATLMKLPGT